MILLDPTTILAMSTLMAAAMSVVMYSCHRSFPKEIKGLGDWSFALVLMVVAVVLFSFQGGSFKLLLAANAFMVWGLGYMMVSTERFFNLRPSWWLFHAVWAAVMACLAYWMFVRTSFTNRVAAFSFLTVIYHARQIFLLWRYGGRHFSNWFFACLILFESVVVVLRGALALTTGNDDVNLNTAGGFQNLYLATAHFMVLLMTVGFIGVSTRRFQTILERRSTLDPLTATLNRRGFADIYIKENALMRRENTLMTMLNIDIDYFKKINDSHGHAVGDRVLIDVAKMIGKALRVSDHIARFGGEEFVVLLPNTGLEQALQITQRIQEALREPRAGIPAYTVSIGVACQASADESLDGILVRADKALYRAKEKGRNRYEIAPAAVLTGTNAPVQHLDRARA